jgi:hypothetical protein
MKTTEGIPPITGVPVIDAPKILEWPADGGTEEPSLSEPTANLANDFHAGIHQCDMVLSTAGNYHMALRELWELFLESSPPDDPLHNWFYTTSPPIIKQQIMNNLVQFGNVRASCRPQVAVAPKKLIDSLIDAGFTRGEPVPISKTRGNVILVRQGNPKDISAIWDLGMNKVRIITPHPELEAGSFTLYARSIYDIALRDPNPPGGMTAEDFFNALFNGASTDPQKWLSGKRIHHREVPWSIAHGKADAAVIFYHLALHAVTVFPDLFDIIPLGGTVRDPDPLPGNHTEVLYAVRIQGRWTGKQKRATKRLIKLFQCPAFASILGKHGLGRP